MISISYRAALRLLPASLRSKHGAAMETMFERELEHARARGPLHVAFAAAIGIVDVVRRSVYELVRVQPLSLGEFHDSNEREQHHVSQHGPQSVRGAHDNPQMDGLPMQGPQSTMPTARQLLTRLSVSFSIAFVVLTTLLISRWALGMMPWLRDHAASFDKMLSTIALGLPFTAALTIPMAVFVAVSYEFGRLGASGTLAAARRVHGGVRQLISPVIAAAVAVSVLALVVTAVITPRTNGKLQVLLNNGKTTFMGNRTMTIGQLRVAERIAKVSGESGALTDAAGYEVEIQKKFALPAACVVLALGAIALAFRFPRGRAWLTVGASVLVFSGYYTLLMAGETLADRLVISPLVAMWGANALILVMATTMLSWTGRAGRNGRAPIIAG